MVTMTNNGQQTFMSKDDNSQSVTTITTSLKSDRRSNKPIMEKRRRARINNCLNELKTLILDAAKKDPSRHAKLEKADILEKTVKHLQDLQKQQNIMAQVADPKVINKFKAGFVECANEVSRFPGVDPMVKRRLLMHLNSVHKGFKQEYSNQHVQHILPSPPSSPDQDPAMNNNHIIQTINGYILPNGLQVLPTKLPNGQIALVLPTTAALHTPALVPIPTRTASTGSASSHSSSTDGSIHYTSPSPTNSYEGVDLHSAVASTYQQQYYQHQQQQQHHHNYHHQQQAQQPISLVVRKMGPQEDDQPWRPW